MLLIHFRETGFRFITTVLYPMVQVSGLLKKPTFSCIKNNDKTFVGNEIYTDYLFHVE
ncbi:hypothetical protein BH10BAC3_BH10BAC3_13630 [soil metagenome]